MEIPMEKSTYKNAVCYMQTGSIHLSEGKECEDTSYCLEKPTFYFYGLADGQSGKTHCKQGAREMLTLIADYIEKRGISNLAEYKYLDEIQYELIRIIREKLAYLAKDSKTAESEFSSTILALGIEPRSGMYVTIHLGDGGILGKHVDGSLNFISIPDNGITSRYTWLTTSKDALLHLRIGFGNFSNYKRVVMYTDGAEAFCRGMYISNSARSFMLKNEDSCRIGEILNESWPTDDASCIVVDCNNASENYI